MGSTALSDIFSSTWCSATLAARAITKPAAQPASGSQTNTSKPLLPRLPASARSSNALRHFRPALHVLPSNGDEDLQRLRESHFPNRPWLLDRWHVAQTIPRLRRAYQDEFWRLMAPIGKPDSKRQPAKPTVLAPAPPAAPLVHTLFDSKSKSTVNSNVSAAKRASGMPCTTPGPQTAQSAARGPEHQVQKTKTPFRIQPAPP